VGDHTAINEKEQASHDLLSSFHNFMIDRTYSAEALSAFLGLSVFSVAVDSDLAELVL